MNKNTGQGSLKSPFSPPACISMSLWQSDPFSWLAEDEALLEMGLVVIHLRRISVICKFKERSAARTISRSGKN